MAPRSSQKTSNRIAAQKREADLSSLLSAAQKTDLVNLVATIIDKMLEAIEAGFEISIPNDAAAKGTENRHPAQLGEPPLLNPSRTANPTNGRGRQGKGSNGVQTRKPNQAPSPGKLNTPNAVESRTEAVNPELKRELLIAFKKWQTMVLKRMGDIAAAKDPHAQQGRPGPRGAMRNVTPARQTPRPAAPPPKNGFATRTSPGKCEPTNELAVKPDVGCDLPAGASRTAVADADANFIQMYPHLATSLCTLPVEKRALLLHSMLLLLLSLDHYNAWSRVLLLRIASCLRAPLHIVSEDEVRVGLAISRSLKEPPPPSEDGTQKKVEETKPPRRWAKVPNPIGTGPNGGLADPMVAVGIGSARELSLGNVATASLMGGMADGGYAASVLFGLQGGRGAGKMLDSYSKDMPDLALLPLHSKLPGKFVQAKDIHGDDRRLRMTIAIAGWLPHKIELSDLFAHLGSQTEAYALRWDLEAMIKVDIALESVVKSAAWYAARKEIGDSLRGSIGNGVLRPRAASSCTEILRLFTFDWPVPLLKISKVVDNHWSVGMVRADKAGGVLADAIINRIAGERGVTLVGYSLGARTIYACLMSLAERRAFGLVENVVLMGAPAPSDATVWTALRSVVVGRLVNVFSERDYLLGFLYRTSSVQFGLAGVHRIEGVPGVKNINATEIIAGHLRYRYLAGRVLQKIGWEDVAVEEVLKAEASLHVAEQKIADNEKKRQQCMVAAKPVPDTQWISPQRRGKKNKKHQHVVAAMEKTKISV
jgi:hypothetical protein